MYKTVFIEHDKGGWEIQQGKTEELEALINRWEEMGHELVSVTACPSYSFSGWFFDDHISGHGWFNFLLVFKTKNNS